MIEVLAMMEMVAVTMIDGRAITVNPQYIMQLGPARDSSDPKRELPDAVKCVIRFLDGSHLSVAETCEEVRALIEHTEMMN